MSDLKRTEILFLYDVQNANPNGDPTDENKPRIDEETGLNIVTDVRLKRTIRDYLFKYKGYDGTNGKDIFIRQTFVDGKEEKGLNDAKKRAEAFKKNAEEVLKRCIDIRMFGGVIPITTGKNKDASIIFTGPVQFKMGRSLHKVKLQHLQGTGAFASKAGAAQNTFREEYILPYSLIVFYGIINENSATETKLTNDDVELLYEAMWDGTKNLITRSKFEHTPRLLLTVTHSKTGFFIGELDRYVELKRNENIKSDEEIRNTDDYVLDFTGLQAKIKKYEQSGSKAKVHKKCGNLHIEGLD